MASNKILLQAKAKRLGVEGYRTMSESELQDVIASAETGKSAPAKGSKGSTVAKGSGNGKATKGSAVKGSTAKVSASKGSVKKGSTTKPARKSAPAKSTSRKSAPAAAKGTAKRQTAAAAKGSSKRAAAKGSTSKAAKRSPAAKSSSIPTPGRPPKGVQGSRATIDLKKIDWTAETNVGAQPGKRQDIVKALKRFKDYDKVFEYLKDNARSYYKGKTKAEAEKLLRWLIARVAYDFALKSGQHEPGTRQPNGQGIRRQATEKPAAARKRSQATGTKGSARKAAPARTARRKTTPARKALAAKRQGSARKKTSQAKRTGTRRALATKGGK